MRVASRALIVALCLAPTLALATPSADLERGRQSFRSRDYQSAIPVLTTLLYPDAQLSRTNDLVEAHLLLGGAHFENGNRDRAREEFERALQLQPDRSISTLQYTEGAVKLFDDVKTEILARQRKEADLKRIAEAKAAIEAYKKSLVVYEAKPYIMNFAPFGAAQYSQKRYLAMGLIGIPQILTFATSVSIYGYLVNKYGLRNDSIPLGESKRALRLQQVEVGTGIAFLGLYAFGVYDAIRHYKPRLRVEGDDSFLPAELRDAPEAPPPAPGGPRKLKKVSLLERLQFAPLITDETVGFGIGWEND